MKMFGKFQWNPEAVGFQRKLKECGPSSTIVTQHAFGNVEWKEILKNAGVQTSSLETTEVMIY